MSLRRARPLAPRIALVVCSVVAAALAVKVEVHWRVDRAQRADEQLAAARGTADRMAGAVRGGAMEPEAVRLLSTPVPGGGGPVESIRLVDRVGRITWSTHGDERGRDIPPPPPLPDHGAEERGWVDCARLHGTWAGFVDGGRSLVAVSALPAEAAPPAATSKKARSRSAQARAARLAAAAPRVLVVRWDVSAEAAARSARHVRYHLSGLIFALLLGIALWWALRRVVSGPIEDLARVAARPDLIAADLDGHAARPDEIGALARAMAAARTDLDVVRRQASERAARLSGAIDAATDGVVFATLVEGRWIVDHVNARFAALCGRPAAFLEGRTVLEGIASFAERVVEREAVEAWIMHALEHPEYEGSKDGALLPPPGLDTGGEPRLLLETTTRPVRDEIGRPFGRLWLVRDVTFERTRERRLARQNQELAALDFVGRRVARSLDRAAILASALDSLREVLEAPFGTVEDLGAEAPLPLAAALTADAFALTGGSVLSIGDVAARPALRQALPASVASLVVLPLRDATGLVAVLVVGRPRAAAFGADEVALLGRMLHPVEAALENARLFARTEEQLVENQTLIEVGRSVGRADALDAVLEDILRVVQVRLLHRNAAILLPDESGETLYVRASVGYHANLASIRLPVAGDSVTARVLRGAEPLNVPDVRLEPGYVAGSDDIRSELALPLVFGDVVLGVLDVESDHLSAFGPDDERLLAAVAAQAAMVLQNARLLVETRARATRFEAVNEIARTVSSTLDPRRLDRAIVTQIARVVPCERYAILHYDHEARRTTRTVVLDSDGGATDDAPFGWDFAEGLDPAGLVAHEAAWIVDVSTAPDLAEARHVARGLPSLVVVPIPLDGVVAAAIVGVSGHAQGFGGDQIRLLETVSYHVGVALKNAQLFARLQQSYTQLDEAQDGLVRSEKLRALGEMASGVAHDFNNVLGAILGRAQLLKQSRGAGDPATAAELDIIEKAARDGAATVRRLQDFTRVRRDHGFQPVSTRQVVEDCLSLTRGRWRDEAERAGVHYDVVTELDDAPDVAGEASELREVVTNLILNALDAMRGGGRLRLATRAVPATGEVHVEVADDGDGMTDEVRARIFDPFFTTKGVRGVGLGLSVVYGIVERHGGRIEVTSAPGAGTTMRVVLPACAALPEAATASPPEAARNGRARRGKAKARTKEKAPALRILVVDDEPGVRSLLEDLLAAAGHRPVAVASGREALIALEAAAEGFDLVLTDLGMPDMSGWDVARAVGELDDPPPVVLVTGWGIQLDDQLLAASGVCDVIAKPFTLEDVLGVAERTARRRRAA